MKPQTSFVIFAFLRPPRFHCGVICLIHSSNSHRLRRNVLLVGLNEGSLELIHEIMQKPQLGYRISAVIDSKEKPAALELTGISFYDDSVDLKQVLREMKLSALL